MSVAVRIKTGQATLAGAAEQQLDPASTNVENIKSISVRAASANTGKLYVGATGLATTTGYELAAGESIAIDINSTAPLFIRGTTADKASWMASV